MDEFKVPTLPPPGPLPKHDKKSNVVPKTEPTPDIKEKVELKQAESSAPYKVPDWSAKPNNQDISYKFEVLKSGQIIEEVDNLQRQAIWKFGRLPENDIVMAHPTISRFHAILQYRPATLKIDDEEEEAKKAPAEGWYIYDLESTHGTFLNKQRIPPRVYIRIRVGHMLRLGASSRSYILQGPVEDEEPESELSVTELREQRLQQQEIAAEMKRKATEAAEERLRNEGIDWGMGEDADEETDLTHNPYASTNNEELFLDDPKKTLRGYFEREDIPLEYKCDEMSAGCFVCRVELNIDDANGRPIVAEVVHKGRKKECVVQCALEACRILDRHGVLRQANQEPLKRRAKNKGSDSDDDEFWDRTGDVARRKQRKANSNSVTLTYDDLVKRETELSVQIQQVEADIAEYQLKQKREKAQKAAQEGADLDSFMEQLDEDVSKLDKTEIKRLRLEQQRLKVEHLKLQRLIKIAKPYELPFALDSDNSASASSNASKKQLPMIGKRNQFSKFKIAKLPSTNTKPNKTYASDEEEIEDDTDEKVEKVENDDKLNTEKACDTTHDDMTTNITAVVETITKEDHQNAPKDHITAENTQIKRPALSPETVSTENTTSNDDVSTSSTGTTTQLAETDSTTMNHQTEDINSDAKKHNRKRQRQRSKKADIDELNEHESNEKYAKWVPPPNQTGDGFTALNEKYGY